MAQFVRLAHRRVNLDTVAFVSESTNGGAQVFFNAGADEDGNLPFIRVNEKEKAYLLHILNWLDATPVSVNLEPAMPKKPTQAEIDNELVNYTIGLLSLYELAEKLHMPESEVQTLVEQRVHVLSIPPEVKG